MKKQSNPDSVHKRPEPPPSPSPSPSPPKPKKEWYCAPGFNGDYFIIYLNQNEYIAKLSISYYSVQIHRNPWPWIIKNLERQARGA